MIKSEELKKAIRRGGYTLDTLSAQIGISRTALFNKIHGKSEFSISELDKIRLLLKMKTSESNKIFFAADVE